jgi:hypothetical protein
MVSVVETAVVSSAVIEPVVDAIAHSSSGTDVVSGMKSVLSPHDVARKKMPTNKTNNPAFFMSLSHTFFSSPL